jgi:hypothetical protein
MTVDHEQTYQLALDYDTLSAPSRQNLEVEFPGDPIHFPVLFLVLSVVVEQDDAPLCH